MIGVLGFDSRRVLEIFLFTTASRTALGPTQPPIQWVPGALSLVVKRPGHEADHSPQSSADVKECVVLLPPLPQYAFIAWCILSNLNYIIIIIIIRTASMGCSAGLAHTVIKHIYFLLSEGLSASQNGPRSMELYHYYRCCCCCCCCYYYYYHYHSTYYHRWLQTLQPCYVLFVKIYYDAKTWVN
jgi:hypothetical protein